MTVPTALSDDRTLGIAVLACVAAVAIYLFVTRPRPVRDAGPGLVLAVAALGTAFLLGVLGGDPREIAHEGTVILLSAVAVACVMAGGLARGATARPAATRWPTRTAPDPLKGNLLIWLATGAVGLALVNLASAPQSIPLLATDIDSARFSGGGVFSSFFVFLIGSLQWVLLLGLTTWAIRRKRPRGWQAVLILGAAFTLILLASRSLIFTPLLTLVLALAITGAMRPSRLLALAVVGLLVLGLAGQYRTTSSGDVTTADLRQAGYDGPWGMVVQSSAVGPWVFGKVLDRVPSPAYPHQHGGFLTGEFRAQFPGDQVFGDPELPDHWVTRVRGATYGENGVGGSPPTLPGGLFIDFGIAGVIAGCLFVGWLLAAVYDWARRAGTIGALSLYAYLTGFIMLSAYNFLSLKPIALTAMALCFITHRAEVSARARRARAQQLAAATA